MAACNSRSSVFFFLGVIFLLVVCLSFQVDAQSSKNVKEPSWQDKLIDWWMSVRVQGATLVLGGLGLSWLIIRLRGKDKYRTEYVQQKKSEEGNRAMKASPSLLDSETNSRGTARSERIKIFFGTQTGKAKSLAKDMKSKAQSLGLTSEVVDLKNYEPEDSLSEEVDTCVFIISTYVDGKPPESAEWFCKWLEEASNDFRVQKSLLSGLDYAVFGLGNSLYRERFNMVGKNVDKWLGLLSARQVFPFGLGDENVANSKHGGTEEDFKFWSSDFLLHFKKERGNSKETACHCATESKSGSNACLHSQEDFQKNDIQDDETLYETTSEEDDDGGDDERENKSGLLDLEDLGPMMNTMKQAKEEREAMQLKGPKRSIGMLQCFKKDDGWYTWIDYPKFHQRMCSYEESSGTENFTALDYMAKTPNWALMGHAQRGFDPEETRWHRKKKKDISGC
ncbi:S-adenosyl-L-methionine-dependent tRNA 4-demethylwyosine synthase-like [Orbicella faveolata]|uniref:S-adenosyl-L-methionine-dependent tRNA 4-demethylwyosine synthase-like n=1 Tax=Orbicella faveolata TaxID=48498 RepID=UPI0009E298E2|nr:S-adenosyl-L-methionine-dependent tRNA 4-demethylwyosine synthase-like [Orbicella faveolata]